MPLHPLIKAFIILLSFSVGIAAEQAVVACQSGESDVAGEHVQPISVDTFFTKIFGIDKTSFRGEFERNTRQQQVTLFSTADEWTKSLLANELADSICQNRLFPESTLSKIIPSISISPKLTIMLQEPSHTDHLPFRKQPEQKTADLSSLYVMLENGILDPEKYLQDMLRPPVQKEEITFASPEASLSQ